MCVLYVYDNLSQTLRMYVRSHGVHTAHSLAHITARAHCRNTRHLYANTLLIN